MAKKRQQPKSAFDNTSKEELKAVGKSILKKAEGTEKVDSPTPSAKPDGKTKHKVVYLSIELHRLAKQKAAMKGMSMKEYISNLIVEDS